MRRIALAALTVLCWCAAASSLTSAESALRLRVRYRAQANALELQDRVVVDSATPFNRAEAPHPGEWLLQGESPEGVPLFHHPIPDPTTPPYDGAAPRDPADFTALVPNDPQLAVIRLLEPEFGEEGTVRRLIYRGHIQLVPKPAAQASRALRWLETALLGEDAYADSTLAFQESNGEVVMQSEHFDQNIPRSGKTWEVRTTLSGFSGSAYLEALPNTGTQFDTGFVTTSPELVFNVQFANPGTYYVWVRGSANSGTDDSVHAGLDGIGPASADRIQGLTTTGWLWKRDTMDGTPATLNIPAAGLHTVHLWMREDGVRVDKWLLRKSSSSTAPSGVGPAESPRILVGPDETGPVISNISAQSIDGTTATVQWTTDEPATSQVEYGLDETYGQSSPVQTSPVIQHLVTLTGLTLSQTYHYHALSQDAAGNLSASADHTFITPSAQASPSFAEVGGQATMEAEHYDQRIDRSGKAWTFRRSRSGYAASGYLEALPNTGTQFDTGFVTTSPELVFNVQFANPGTYYVWVRGSANSGTDDSVHAGLDGIGPASADRIQGLTTTGWLWKRDTMDGTPATLNIPAAGLHTVHLWMREDGVRVDKWLLRKSSSSTAPSGVGPNETGLKPRLMALGASIVQGVGDADTFGFRDHLQQAIGIGAMQYVGTYQDPATNPAYDVDHEGIPGNETGDVEARLPAALNQHMRVTNPPGSMVLLHIGTNDILSGDDEAATVQNIRDIVNLINAHDPSVKVFVALILPCTLPATDAAFSSFNTALAADLEQLRQTKPNLYTVDMHAAFTANPDWANQYMSDTIHPNDAGYQVMAQTWQAAIAASP